MDDGIELLRSNRDRLFELIDQFSEATVLVVGDLTLDEFLNGEVERVSREAPVLILRHEETQQIPGGGANAVYNFARLGATVKAVGLLGKDSQGQTLLQLFEAAGIDTEGIVWDVDRPTVTKTRISGHARQSVTQQIVRVDRKSNALPALELQQQLAAYIRDQIDQVDAIVCSDYGDGTLTQPVIEAALEHPRTIVDSQKQISRYQDAMIFTPNLPEAELAVGYEIEDAASLSRAGQDLLRLTHAQYILITRGERGMTLFDRSGNEDHIPAFNHTKVFDVTGAGDTVVAALTLGLIAGATVWEAVILGNLAASIVVRRFGTTTTTATEMKMALETLIERSEQPLTVSNEFASMQTKNAIAG
ncbi:MAG: bifunctional hydroxymethylpyrimidine kinase/phosphomethylpyrimidine kinase [Plectolyngbya sp. WJT66-NPBG17]|jgi:rfaE bifunctional protein kinase chain/domain|nr:bifunctional hydroxymethylpyrimidine kinase/phosphomethylpyrimidine kinase [Plectolyngbya sp. WJT66-NPBG17]